LYYQIGKKKGDAAAGETLEEILLLPVKFHEARRQDVLQAAQNKMRFPLSYADAFAVALAQSLDGIILTGNPEILKLDLGIKVEKLERH
jgi:predicted nucleic acid-binding protein